MKKIKLLILFALLFVLFSCSQKDRYENAQEFKVSDFRSSDNLKGTILNFDSLIMRPSELIVIDSLLIVIEPSKDKLFSLFNLKNKKEVGSRINKGQGPNDMLRPRFLGYKNNIIKIMDMATSTMFEYNITNFINDINPIPSIRIKLENPIFIDVEMVGDYIIGYIDNSQYQLSVFNAQGKEVNKMANYPGSSVSFTDMEKKETYYMNFTTDGLNRIAISYYMTDLIEIYDIKGNLQKRLFGPEQFISRVKEYNDENISGSSPIKGSARDAFFSPVNAGDEFFVLYNGRYIDDPNHSSSCNQIFSFSWQGVPKKIYNLDDPVFSFTVDTKNKKIYGISNTPEFHIVEYSYY